MIDTNFDGMVEVDMFNAVLADVVVELDMLK